MWDSSGSFRVGHQQLLNEILINVECMYCRVGQPQEDGEEPTPHDLDNLAKNASSKISKRILSKSRTNTAIKHPTMSNWGK